MRRRRHRRRRRPSRIVHPRRQRAPDRARQRRRRRDADARDAARAPRPRVRRATIWWFHGARNRAEHAFADEATVAAGRPRARAPLRLLQPSGPDRPRRHRLRRGRSHHRRGARDAGVPTDGDVLPVRTDCVHGRPARRARSRSESPADRVHTEVFGAHEAITPGIAADAARPPHPPDGAPGTGPLVSFVRIGARRALGRRVRAASSSSPRRATCRCAGRAAPASATPARPVCSTVGSTTSSNRSRHPPTATCSSAARAPTRDLTIDL